MLLVALLGSKRDLLLAPLVRMLSSRGYRVATLTQASKLRVPEELREAAEAGASIRMACSVDRVLISSNFPLKELNEMIKVISSLAPIEPDAVVILGFDEAVASDSRVMKVIAASSSSEANQIISRISQPIIGTYSARGDLESGYSTPESLAEAVISEGMRRKLLQPSPGRISSDG